MATLNVETITLSRVCRQRQRELVRIPGDPAQSLAAAAPGPRLPSIDPNIPNHLNTGPSSLLTRESSSTGGWLIGGNSRDK